MLGLVSLGELVRARLRAGSGASRSRQRQEQCDRCQVDAAWSHLLSSIQTPPRSWRAHPFVCATHVIIKAVDVALEDLLLALVSGGMACERPLDKQLTWGLVSAGHLDPLPFVFRSGIAPLLRKAKRGDPYSRKTPKKGRSSHALANDGPTTAKEHSAPCL